MRRARAIATPGTTLTSKPADVNVGNHHSGIASWVALPGWNKATIVTTSVVPTSRIRVATRTRLVRISPAYSRCYRREQQRCALRIAGSGLRL
ncbi:hypothetical protein NJB1907Z4_P0270 (plasmid) [Mycobacterium pseudoshottsii]|uniref:Uncharacterized protein n=1 Tax=Mycobacterium pseudoshottsii TaxID=265949 RepID=A0A9N7QRE9_9MYCO|nr:hypothetical protein NJB1907Z4_P0270 [Mycobacterium pseudoshottsii]